MTSERCKELQRQLSAHQAGLGSLDPAAIAEEALEALRPLLGLLENIRGPVGDLTKALEEYELQAR